MFICDFTQKEKVGLQKLSLRRSYPKECIRPTYISSLHKVYTLVTKRKNVAFEKVPETAFVPSDHNIFIYYLSKLPWLMRFVTNSHCACAPPTVTNKV